MYNSNDSHTSYRSTSPSPSSTNNESENNKTHCTSNNRSHHDNDETNSQKLIWIEQDKQTIIWSIFQSRMPEPSRLSENMMYNYHNQPECEELLKRMICYLTPNSSAQGYKNIISQKLDAETLVSPLVLRHKTIHQDMPNLLMINVTQYSFKDIAGNTPVSSKIIEALWPGRHDELTTKWKENKKRYEENPIETINRERSIRTIPTIFHSPYGLYPQQASASSSTQRHVIYETNIERNSHKTPEPTIIEPDDDNHTRTILNASRYTTNTVGSNPLPNHIHPQTHLGYTERIWIQKTSYPYDWQRSSRNRLQSKSCIEIDTGLL